MAVLELLPSLPGRVGVGIEASADTSKGGDGAVDGVDKLLQWVGPGIFEEVEQKAEKVGAEAEGVKEEGGAADADADADPERLCERDLATLLPMPVGVEVCEAWDGRRRSKPAPTSLGLGASISLRADAKPNPSPDRCRRDLIGLMSFILAFRIVFSTPVGTELRSAPVPA